MDKLLGKFVSLVNQDMIGTGVTLTVGGVIITGNIISTKGYVEELASGFETAGEFGVAVGKSLREADIEYGSEQTSDDVEEIIHLKDAKVLSGNTVYNVGLWRGKVNSVDGFTIGLLNTN